jgi:transposase InsO family protein
LLNQKFVASAPNRVWLADITYIATCEKWLYLAAVLDSASRRIVGWSMRDHMRTELPLAALMMAAQRQTPPKPSSVPAAANTRPRCMESTRCNEGKTVDESHKVQLVVEPADPISVDRSRFIHS